MDMFEHQAEELKKKEAPLATRMRPASFHEFVGQGENMLANWILLSISGGTI